MSLLQWLVDDKSCDCIVHIVSLPLTHRPFSKSKPILADGLSFFLRKHRIGDMVNPVLAVSYLNMLSYVWVKKIRTSGSVATYWCMHGSYCHLHLQCDVFYTSFCVLLYLSIYLSSPCFPMHVDGQRAYW